MLTATAEKKRRALIAIPFLLAMISLNCKSSSSPGGRMRMFSELSCAMELP